MERIQLCVSRWDDSIIVTSVLKTEIISKARMCWLKSKTLLLCLNSSSNWKKKKIKDNSWLHITSGMSIILLSFWSLQFQSKTRNFKGFKSRPSERHSETSRRKPIIKWFSSSWLPHLQASPPAMNLFTLTLAWWETHAALWHTQLFSASEDRGVTPGKPVNTQVFSPLCLWRPEAGVSFLTGIWEAVSCKQEALAFRRVESTGVWFWGGAGKDADGATRWWGWRVM